MLYSCSRSQFKAAVAGHKRIIAQLLEFDIPPTSATKLFCVPLHAACANGHLECAQVLLASGLDINLRDDVGGTPLMRASVSGHVDIVRWLLANGADPTLRETPQGKWNALELGAGRDLGVTRMLLDVCGWSPTALMAAASFGKLEAFELIARAAGLSDLKHAIMDRESWLTILSKEQREAVLGAIDQGGSGGSLEMLQYLLAFISSDIVHDEYVAPVIRRSVERAACGNHREVVELLLNFLKDHDMNDHELSELANALLIYAAGDNAVETAKLLLEDFGANVNFLAKPQNMSPLHFAVLHDHPPMIELLVQTYHADIHLAGGKCANGPTPLWYAVDGQLELSARALLACGGPVESIDIALVESQDARRVFISAGRTYRAPVRLRVEMDRAWDDEHSTERFLCLEYPDRWPGGVQTRRPDGELADERELRIAEDGGFMVVYFLVRRLTPFPLRDCLPPSDEKPGLGLG